MEKRNLQSIQEKVNNIKKDADAILNEFTIYKAEKMSDLKENQITLYGIFKNNDNTDSTFRTDCTTNDLLDLDTEEVTKLLTAFGNYERFRIIRLLLDGGKTVNDIVKELNFKTTGKAYHHLNSLVSSGLVFKWADGRYHFHAKHIQGIMALLVGCHSYINKNRPEYYIELESLKS